MTAPSIARLAHADLTEVRALLEPSGLHVELEAELTRDIALPWVRRDATGVIVGFMLAWSVADELHLLELATARAHRRKGHARALLDELLALAKKDAKRLVLLEVRRSNVAAIRLYESLGFELTGVRPRYYADNDEDGLEMRITFDPETGAIVRDFG